jgi:aspartyl/asparaginyl-tRNA synthetase
LFGNDFERLTYTEAIEILKESTPNKKKKFQYPVEGWGTDLQSEHERYLVEKHFKKPVILTNYPKEIKSFYMRQNDDGKTVAAMDILFPGIGEISAARSVKSVWISWKPVWTKWASLKMNFGGTWIPAASAHARMPALA